MRYSLMLACLLTGAALAASTGVTHVKVFCKVYVDESGMPSKAEVVGTEPKVVLDKQAREDVLSMSIYSRTFPVRFDGHKPVAGYRTIPVDIEFDTPVPLDHN
jgi:hypothetical protein